jgi:hypothetical protein
MKLNVSVNTLCEMKVLWAPICLPVYFISEITEHISIKFCIEGLHQKLSSEFRLVSYWSSVRVAQCNLRVADIFWKEFVVVAHKIYITV